MACPSSGPEVSGDPASPPGPDISPSAELLLLPFSGVLAEPLSSPVSVPSVELVASSASCSPVEDWRAAYSVRLMELCLVILKRLPANMVMQARTIIIFMIFDLSIWVPFLMYVSVCQA